MNKIDLGQFFIVGFDGCGGDQSLPLMETIVEDNIGGIILFDRNVDGSRQNIHCPEQLKKLTKSLQQHAQTPLLVTVDQEGGRVCRLKEKDGFASTVSAKWLGDQNDAQLTRKWAARGAKVLADHGINFNLAPVLDLDLNPDNPIISYYERSYGVKCEDVVKHASIWIEEHHRCQVACCLKHFPGHGSSGSDSHLGFVDITETWQEQELEPYREMFARGFSDAVMSAHVVNKKIDPTGKPATLSATVMGSLLRDKLNFSGVTLSDDLQMRAIADFWSFEEAVQQAVMAGVDLIIVGNNLIRDDQAARRGVEAIWSLLEEGKVEEEALRRSLERITTLKRKIAGEIHW